MGTQKLQKSIDAITSQLIAKYRPQKIILFGSGATGRFTSDSDLDFFVIKKETSTDFLSRVRQIRQLVDTDLPCDFLVAKPEEVSSRLALGDPFIKDIMTHGKVLYD